MSEDAGWQIALRGRVGDLSLDVELSSGLEPLVLIGPNGSGKTSLLRAIAGAPIEVSGRIALSGRTIADAQTGVSLPPEQRQVGYVPQGFALFEHMTVLHNVAFGAGRGRAGIERASQWLRDLEIENLAHRRPGTLSAGEAQQIALARALAAHPRGLLLDEPLAALDIGNRRRTRKQLVRRLREASIPTIVVTHEPADVVAIGGSVVALEHGSVVQRGSLRELAEQPATAFVAEFLELVAPQNADPAQT